MHPIPIAKCTECIIHHTISKIFEIARRKIGSVIGMITTLITLHYCVVCWLGEGSSYLDTWLLV